MTSYYLTGIRVAPKCINDADNKPPRNIVGLEVPRSLVALKARDESSNMTFTTRRGQDPALRKYTKIKL